MITGLNKSKILKEHISGKCKCKSDGKRCNSNQMQNKNKCQFVKKNYSWSPSTSTWENGNYLGSIICDSVITYDKIGEVNRTFSKKKKNCSKKNCSDKNCSKKTYSNKI